MILAKTAAAGDRGLLPEVLAFSSSMEQDRALVREDLIGSLAHLTMLSRTRIVAASDAATIRAGLVDLWTRQAAGSWHPDGEEDVHMAVEAALTQSLGDVAGRLHTARSRNDQVALDLRLHVREQTALGLESLASLLAQLTAMAREGMDVILPAYTHRQRAMPVSLGYVLAGWGAMFARDVDALAFVLQQVDSMPLGVGAIAGTSLPTDREITRGLLGFSRLSANGLDTVGDRDFALDQSYATARLVLHASRVSTDLIDFATGEFGFVTLDGQIACGSSMMPQKKNPDVFELLRGKSGAAVGNLMTLLTLVKGLPGGYNRDLQEDRGPLLSSGPLARNVLDMLTLALGRVTFNREKCWAAIAGDYTQATDLAEALVIAGHPFRSAYQAVGSLVRKCQERSLPLAQVTLELAQSVDARFTPEVLLAADPKGSVARKESAGGTGPKAVAAQLTALEGHTERARALARSVPRLAGLFDTLKEASL
jgi:argininosuccinate lyase